MNTLRATLHDGRVVEYLPDMIGEGGMKRVYFTADRKSVVCFFKDKATSRDPNRLARLEAILDSFNPTLDLKTGAEFSGLYCWPTGIVVQPELGVMAPAYSSDFFFGSGRFQGKEKEGKWFSSPKLRKLLPESERGNWLNYLQVCIRIARAIRKMHFTGLAHSDLSCRNILVDPPRGRCSVIDIDSLVVPGKFPPDVLGTPGYIAPEVMATQGLPVGDPNRHLPSIKTDLYALPVLIYEYLLRRHPLRGPKVNSTDSTEEDERLSMGEKALFIENPHDKSNRPKSGLNVTYEQLGPSTGPNARRYLPNLFYRAFVEGLHNPNARPTADEWEKALCRTTDLLIPCGNSACEEKWFAYIEGQKPRCPFCGWSLQQRIPVLEFHYAPRRGQFRPEGHSLVAWNQRPLHRWHAFTNVQPVEGVDKESVAYVAFHQKGWILVNKHLESLVSASGNPVPTGQACLLNDGDEIQLSKEDKGRLISVRMIP